MSDSNYSSVVLLASYQTDFSDAKGHTVTTHGSPAPSLVSASPSPPTGALKSAALVAANGNFFDYGTSSDFNTGTGDFTAEAFFYLNSRASYRTIIGKGGGLGSNTGWGVHTAANGALFAEVNAQSVNISGGSVSLSAWHHVALVRASGTWSLYFDGARIATSTNQATTDVGSSDTMAIGYTPSGGQYWDGDLAYARVTKGVARYTGATYTVPTIPGDFQSPSVTFTVNAGVFALAGQAAPGKTGLAAGKGSFGITGRAGTFSGKFSPAKGVFVLSGIAPHLKYTLAVSVSPFALTGKVAGLALALHAAPDALALSGAGATFPLAFTPAPGAFAVTGTIPKLELSCATSVQGYADTGKVSALKVAMPVRAGAFVLTGHRANAGSGAAVTLQAESVAYAFRGIPIEFLTDMVQWSGAPQNIEIWSKQTDLAGTWTPAAGAASPSWKKGYG